MAMEEEFAVEIPDAEADKIQSIPEAVSYLAANPNAKQRDFSDNGVVAAKALARGVVSKRAKVFKKQSLCCYNTLLMQKCNTKNMLARA